MGLIGCYSIHLYCDHPQHGEHDPEHLKGEFIGETQGQCLAVANSRGWRINWRRYDMKYGRGYATCPWCNKLNPPTRRQRKPILHRTLGSRIRKRDRIKADPERLARTRAKSARMAGAWYARLKNDPERYAVYLHRCKARNTARAAVKSGKLTRPEACEKCGSPCKPDAHHHDYDQPLSVEWLCRRCHRIAEGKNVYPQ